MSNEQYPNPWSRDAANQPGTPGVDADAPRGSGSPVENEATTRIDGPASAQTPTGPTQHAPQQAAPQPEAAPQQAAWAPPSYSTAGTPGAGWQQGPQPNPGHAASYPAAPAKKRSRLAGVLAVALVAAGVGGTAGYAGSQLADGTWSLGSAAVEGASSATETKVVQADPENPNWSTVAESAVESVVAITVSGQNGSGSQGSGVVIDPQGHIVTNNHVVAAAGQGAQLIVTMSDATYVAEVVGTDPSTDLAVIQLVDPPSDLSVMAFADETRLQVGDPVMAVGNPLGLDDTVTTGIVSALNRPVTTQAVTGNQLTSNSDSLVVTAAIQTNAAINPGNSGGALVNSSGELVGVTSSIASLASSSSSQAGNIGLGFAIGSNQVRYVAEQLIEQGYAEHPQIGISATDTRTTGPMGALVAEVVSGSPADTAGLEQDDLITRVDGAQVTSTESLVALVRNGEVGKEMHLTVLRGGREIDVTVTPMAADR